MAFDCEFRSMKDITVEVAHWIRTIKETDVDRRITDLVSDISPCNGIGRGCTLKISITRLK
jgi:hypothetical protein